MPRRLGSRQQAGLRQIVQNGGGLRAVVAQAQRNANATGNSVIRELVTLARRGNANAQTVTSLLRRGGARTGGSGSSGG